MEAWSFARYGRPYLDVGELMVNAAVQELLVETTKGQYVVEMDGGIDADSVRWLQALRHPDAREWQDAGSVAERADLLQQMDYLGLVRDADEAERLLAVVDGEMQALSGEVDAWSKRLIDSLSATHQAAFSDHARILLEYALALLAEIAPSDFASGMDAEQKSPASIFASDNFYLQAAMIQLLYQRKSAPVSLLASCRVLLAVTAHFGLGIQEDIRGRIMALQQELAGGLYDLRAVQTHLECLWSFLSRSHSADAKRYCVSSIVPSECRSGIDFNIDVEQIVADTIGPLGEPRFLQAIAKPDAPMSLVQGCYLQEYHVTCRFVEILTPMMNKRLAAPLRNRMFRYYAEEVGHEQFEYDTCRKLGLSEEEIARSVPLPLHAAYIDAFTCLADIDPVGYFVSLFITEGVLGVSPPLDPHMRRLTGSDASFDEAAGKHAALNDEYNHTSLSRLFMSEIACVSPKQQRSAIAFMLFLLELNYRAWDDLLDHYSPVAGANHAAVANPG